MATTLNVENMNAARTLADEINNVSRLRVLNEHNDGEDPRDEINAKLIAALKKLTDEESNIIACEWGM